MATDYFKQGLALGQSVRRHKKESEDKAKESEEKLEKARLKAVEAQEKALKEEVNTKARLAYSVLNSGDPEANWQRAKKTHPGLVNDDTDRRVLQDWAIGGVESGVLGKAFITQQQKQMTARLKSLGMQQAQGYDEHNALRDNKLKRGMVDYKLEADKKKLSYATDQRLKFQQAGNENAREMVDYKLGANKEQTKYSADQRLRLQNSGMQNDRERGAIAIAKQRDNARLKVAPSAPPVTPPPSTQAPQSFGGGANGAGMEMVNSVMGGKANPQEVAAVWKDTSALVESRGLDMEKDGPKIASSISRVKATESKVVKVLGSIGVNPDDAVVALRAVAKQNLQASDDDLVRLTMQYIKGMK